MEKSQKKKKNHRFGILEKSIERHLKATPSYAVIKTVNR